MTTPDHILPPPLRDAGPLETMARVVREFPMAQRLPTAVAIKITEDLAKSGYAIVPVEPSVEQHMAMHDVVLDPDWRPPYVAEIYAAAIAAAPPLNTKEGE